jgi:glyoxylase-like metal-dependent hydrolase (beta-lactamase superfamily II)
LLWDSTEVVLIDTGYPHQFEELTAQLALHGFNPADVTQVILTHQDLDHIGNARRFKELGAQVLASAIEAPYIQGDITPIKFTDLAERRSQFSPERIAFIESWKRGFSGAFVQVDRFLSDGEVLLYGGGIQVVATPGHTPGHIVLLLLEPKVVVLGDAGGLGEDGLAGFPSDLNHNQVEAEASLAKIETLGASGYVCFHGGYLKA